MCKTRLNTVKRNSPALVLLRMFYTFTQSDIYLSSLGHMGFAYINSTSLSYLQILSLTH